MVMDENWKDIKGYEGDYQVSNIGNIRSLHFGICGKSAKPGETKNLKLILKSNGYYAVSLRGKQMLVHRLVASAFIPNPSCKPYIDHINTITTDNRIENLRWVNPYENLRNPISYNRRLKAVRERMSGKYGIESNKHRKVFQFSLDGKFIQEWGCMSDACRKYGIDSGSMTNCCKGICQQCKGYIWRYDLCPVKPVIRHEKRIVQYMTNGSFVKEWDKVTDAAKFYNTSTGRICSCLKGYTKSCKGFIWKYA